MMKDPIPGVQVTNPAPAAGGRAAETLPNALVRGPSSRDARAVARGDGQRLPEPGAQCEQRGSRGSFHECGVFCKFARPGTVEVILVPAIPPIRSPRGAGNVAATPGAPDAGGPAIISALAPSGDAVTGIGSLATQGSQEVFTVTLPAR